MTIGSRIQPKKQSKVQIIGILEEIDQKSTYEKVTKIWAGPSPTPLHLDKIQKNSNFFFVKPSLKDIPTSLKVSVIPKVLMVTLFFCICIITVQSYIRSHHKYNGIIPEHLTA